MTADEFANALKKLQLTDERFGEFVQRDERTVRRWRLGDVPVPFLIEREVINLLKKSGFSVKSDP